MMQRKVRAKAGESVEIELHGAGTTGYLWLCEADDRTVDVLDRIVDADTQSFGGKGRETFVLRPQRKGVTSLRFVLKRPWENEPLEVEEVELEVE